MKIKEYLKSLNEKKIAVIGIGISNVPLIKFLSKSGAKITALDKRKKCELEETCEELEKLGISFILGEDYLDKIPANTEIIFKTPGLRCDVPQLLKAVERGAVLTSDTELFFELCPAEIIAVTGSDGKTTTTTLIYEMLKKEGYDAFVGGNIGLPLFENIEKIKPDSKVVIELSSFQLHTLKKSPQISVVTNITPNHLNWHRDYNEYIEAKKNIFAYRPGGARVVLNYDNEITKGFADDSDDFVMFSRKFKLSKGYFLKNNFIVKASGNENAKEILDINKIKIPGMHNVENYMAAIAATEGLVSNETVRYVAENFGGVEHRIELVRKMNGISYYNDSIASSPARTEAGLNSFKQKVILIAGGYDKKIPFDDFGKVVNEHVKELILVGNTSEKIKTAVLNADNYNGLKIHVFGDFKEAVEFSRECAESGDVVILSPACASFDLFKNFEERGKAFKDIVNAF